MEVPFASLTEIPKTACDIPKHRQYDSTPSSGSLERVDGVETRLKYTRIAPGSEATTTAMRWEGSTEQARALIGDHKKIRKIACLGSGFVGGTTFNSAPSVLILTSRLGPTSAVIAFKTDVKVTVVDLNAARIAAWNSEALPIYEPGLSEIVRFARDGLQSHTEAPLESSPQSDQPLVGYDSFEDCILHERPMGLCQKQQSSNLFFSTDIERSIEEADLIFVCVNTPTKTNGIGRGSAPDLGYVEAATRTIARVASESKIVVEKSTVPCRTAQSIREIVSRAALPSIRMRVLDSHLTTLSGHSWRPMRAQA